MRPSYATAVVGEHGVLEGVFDDDLGAAHEGRCCEECSGLHGLEDMLPGSASKGATIGATVGSVIPGVGTAVGGAVGAAAGAIADFVGGIGGKHCNFGGHDVPCPDCKIGDLDCFKRWVLGMRARAAAPSGLSPMEVLLQHAHQQATAARPPPPPRRVAAPRSPPRPAPVMRPMRTRITPRVEAPAVEREGSAVPMALGAVALAVAGGGAWWWWRRTHADNSMTKKEGR